MHESFNLKDAAHQGSSDKSFGLIFAVFFLIAFTFLLLKYGSIYWSLFIVSGVFFVMSFVASKLLSPLHRLWLRLGELLHKIVSPVIFAVIYFLLITPISLLKRIVSGASLELKFNKDVKSYWIVREPLAPSSSNMFNQF